MRDGEWRLIYPGTNYLFGGPPRRPVPVFNLPDSPDLGDAEVRAEDVEQPRSDGILMGRDFRGGRTITFDLGVKGTAGEVHDLVGELVAAWDADSIRRDPGAVAELRCSYAGRERVVYGRPRRVAPVTGKAIFGYGGATADFQTIDHRFYSVAEQQVTTGLVAATGGGVASPLTTPLATTGSTDRSVVMDVDSRYPVWPVITIEGPITDPEVEILGLWKVQLRQTLAYDQSATIDTRPWRRRVSVDPGGRNLRGSLTRDSVRLINASVPRGLHEVAFRGRTDSGAPTMSIRWQNAHAAP